VILLDRLLVGGLRFVLGRIKDAVDAELNDEEFLRQELLAAQMRLELDEITPEEFAQLERDVFRRRREIRARRLEGAASFRPGEVQVTGAEVSLRGGHEGDRDR
jgi:hypothetical protein